MKNNDNQKASMYNQSSAVVNSVLSPVQSYLENAVEAGGAGIKRSKMMSGILGIIMIASAVVPTIVAATEGAKESRQCDDEEVN